MKRWANLRHLNKPCEKQKGTQQIYNVLNFTFEFGCFPLSNSRTNAEKWAKEVWWWRIRFFSWLCSVFFSCSSNSPARISFHFLMLAYISYANVTRMINYSVWYPIWFVCLTRSFFFSLVLSFFLSCHIFTLFDLLFRNYLPALWAGFSRVNIIVIHSWIYTHLLLSLH